MVLPVVRWIVRVCGLWLVWAVMVSASPTSAVEVDPNSEVATFGAPEPLVDLVVKGLEIHAVSDSSIYVFDVRTGALIDRVILPTSGGNSHGALRRIAGEQVLIGEQVWWAGESGWRELSLFWEAPNVHDILYANQVLFAAHDRLEWWDGASYVSGLSQGSGEPLLLAEYGSGVMAHWRGPPSEEPNSLRVEFFTGEPSPTDLWLTHERTVVIEEIQAGEPVVGIAPAPNGGFVVARADAPRFFLHDATGKVLSVLATVSHPAAQSDFRALTSDRCDSLYLAEGGGSSDWWGIMKVVPSYHDPGCFIDDYLGYPFEADIAWLGREGITRGCNPPLNDLFCPDADVTRGQMAAFLHRALSDLVEPIQEPTLFVDVGGSAFEDDIAWLSSTGTTKGCNPSEGNTKFCPDENVTREQMAAFLVRALGYTDDGGGDLFIDDDLSIFERDIDRLATAGVTKGCNPSDGNNEFCPKDYVTRGQMAAFLHRALG